MRILRRFKPPEIFEAYEFPSSWAFRMAHFGRILGSIRPAADTRENLVRKSRPNAGIFERIRAQKLLTTSSASQSCAPARTRFYCDLRPGNLRTEGARYVALSWPVALRDFL